MTYALTPGVYREEVFLRPAGTLPTGVPGFAGFGQTAGGAPVLLHRAEDLAQQFTPAAGLGGFVADAVAGFFANGGARCYVVGAAPDANPTQAVKALEEAIAKFGPLADLDLVAAPDAMLLAPFDAAAPARRVQQALLAHCAAHGNRFSILDAPPGLDPADTGVELLLAWRLQLVAGAANPANGALYYPWVRSGDAAAPGGSRAVPPCGHVAGVYARSDRRVGVFKAPANEELTDVLDVEFPVDAATQDRLNPEGINCLRAFPGRGLRVWGARTLSSDAAWRYVNVRRLLLTLARWIDRNLSWASFEPNTPRLWNRITRELGNYLGTLFQQGALKGASATEAYYVKCDAETNPAEEREQGRVSTEIGLAPALPGEFIVVRILHREGVSSVSA